MSTFSKFLAQTGPSKIVDLLCKTNANCSKLKEHLDFLLTHSLVDERIVEKQKVVYSIKQRGITDINLFKEQTQVLSIIQEDKQCEVIL